MTRLACLRRIQWFSLFYDTTKRLTYTIILGLSRDEGSVNTHVHKVMRMRSLKLWFRILEQEVGSPESVGAEAVVCVCACMCWGHSPVSRVTCPVPTGVLPGAAPPGAAHGQRHAEVGLHAQRHHRAEKAGCGPVGSCHQVGAAEDQGAAGRATSPAVASPTGPHASPQKPVASTVCVFVSFKPDSDMDPNSSGEGVNSVSSSIKRGLSVDSAQEVKRFRTATGAISAVRSRAHAVCFLLQPLRFLVGVCSLTQQISNVG